MTDQRPPHPNRVGQLQDVLTDKTPKVIEDFREIGLPSLEVWPGVFDPATSFSGKFLANILYGMQSLYTNARVLDMACGSGILGLVCAIQGAKSVTCTDISSTASANALRNADKLGLKIDSVHGDLFSALDESLRFDVILFNPPGFEGIASSEIDAHYVCPFSVIDSFYSIAPKFLAKNGSIISATSDLHDLARSPKTLSKKFGYACSLVGVAESSRGRQYAYQVKPHTQ